jgi:hypothetical protein
MTDEEIQAARPVVQAVVKTIALCNGLVHDKRAIDSLALLAIQLGWVRCTPLGDHRPKITQVCVFFTDRLGGAYDVADDGTIGEIRPFNWQEAFLIGVRRTAPSA